MCDKSNTCPSCKTIDLNTNKNYFFTFDVKRSLQELLNVADVAKDLSQNIKKRTDRRSNDISYVEEIFDGKLYKAFRNLEEFDLTGTVNSDGVPCCDSSKFSVWPFLISLHELSYYVRRKHTIIAALWFGKEKPVFTTFLKPIVQELNEISKQRLSWISDGIPVSSSLVFPLLAADSVTRCSLQGLTQFNGAYGCPTCLEKGETHWESESSHKWIYKSHNAPKRTHAGFLQDIGVLRENLVLRANCSSFHAIKESTPLLLLKTFDIVNGFTFDYMHTVELGTSSKKVYEFDIQTAKTLLYEFASNVESLYGKSFCSFNVHLLTHAADCVENWGPL
ncbi:unnamed protein product, partial [Allacma fusca]